MRNDTKHNESADADTEQFHWRELGAETGVSETSSIQAKPWILLSNCALRRRLAQIKSSRVSVAAVQFSWIRDQGCVPRTSSVQATECVDSPTEYKPKRTP